MNLKSTQEKLTIQYIRILLKPEVTTLKSLKRQPEGPKGGYVLKKRACNNIKPMW